MFDLANMADRRGLLLTFDDGGKSAVRIADLLDKKGWKGHFFVTTSLIDTSGFVTPSNILDLTSPRSYNRFAFAQTPQYLL